MEFAKIFQLDLNDQVLVTLNLHLGTDSHDVVVRTDLYGCPFIDKTSYDSKKMARKVFEDYTMDDAILFRKETIDMYNEELEEKIDTDIKKLDDALKAQQMEILRRAELILKEMLHAPWMDDTDWKDILESFKTMGITVESIADDLFKGMLKGYTIDQQVEKLRTFLNKRQTK